MEDRIMVCRWCTTHLEGQASNIFSGNDTIVPLISRCFGIAITPMANVPEVLCSDCVCKIKDIGSFREKVLEAETRWKEITTSETEKNHHNDELEIIFDQESVHIADETAVTMPEDETVGPSDTSVDKVNETKDEESLLEFTEIVEEEFEEIHSPISIDEQLEESKESSELELSEIIEEGFSADPQEETFDELIEYSESDLMANEEQSEYSIKKTTSKNPQTEAKPRGPNKGKGTSWYYQKADCPVCTEQFENHFIMRKHWKEQHSSGPVTYRCSKCPKTFANINGLRTHRNTIHRHANREDVPSSVLCDICGATFANNFRMQKHRKQSHFPAYEACPICGKKVREVSNHIKHVHEVREETCDRCGMVFDKQLRYKYHIARCGKKPTLACKVCGKLYYQAQDLAEHENKHYGITVKCLFCPFEAPDRRTRNNHMNVNHTEEYKAHQREQTEKRTEAYNKRIESYEQGPGEGVV